MRSKPQQSLNKLENKKEIFRSGNFYSINTKRAKGHKGQLRELNKNGTAKGIIVTHAPYTRGKQKIQFCQNPQSGDNRKAYVVSKPEKINVKQLGKHHPDMKVKNSNDKAKIRNIVKRK